MIPIKHSNQIIIRFIQYFNQWKYSHENIREHYIIQKRFSDLLALEVWVEVSMQSQSLKSFDSTLQVFRLYLLALVAYTGI